MHAESDPNLDLQSDMPSPPRLDVTAMVVCLLVNLVFHGVNAKFETIATPFLMEQHHLTNGTASFRISFIRLARLLIYVSLQADRAPIFGPRARALRFVHGRGGPPPARRARRLGMRIRARVRDSLAVP